MVDHYKYYLEYQAAGENHLFVGNAVKNKTIDSLKSIIKAMTTDQENIAIL